MLKITLKDKRLTRFRRAGLVFVSSEPVFVEEDSLSSEQLKALKAESALKVEQASKDEVDSYVYSDGHDAQEKDAEKTVKNENDELAVKNSELEAKLSEVLKINDERVAGSTELSEKKVPAKKTTTKKPQDNKAK